MCYADILAAVIFIALEDTEKTETAQQIVWYAHTCICMHIASSDTLSRCKEGTVQLSLGMALTQTGPNSDDPAETHHYISFPAL